MRQAIIAIRYYARAFQSAVRENGFRYALRRTYNFLLKRLKNTQRVRNTSSAPVAPVTPSLSQPDVPKVENVKQSAVTMAVSSLDVPQINRPLLLIISDIQISQCIHFRIEQKIRFLKKIGVPALHLTTGQRGRIRAFLGLAHTVIVYRTAVADDLMDELYEAKSRILFEVDDLILGQKALEDSEILLQVSSHQADGLKMLSHDLLSTAQKCHALIVSTPYLAEFYSEADYGLSDKTCFVLPNFIDHEEFCEPRKKSYTFAYTSPSTSIQSELSMLKGFLAAYDKEAKKSWNILVMGNDYAKKELSKVPFKRGSIISSPFKSLPQYHETLGHAETVLIPLSDTPFNHAKTAIRLMDAALVGTQAIFCPLGEYAAIGDALQDKRFCIASEGWAKSGGEVGPHLLSLRENVADLQSVIRKFYGSEAAVACYEEIFIEDMKICSSV